VLVQQAWEYFRNVQTKDTEYETFLSPEDKPAVEMNKEKMERFAPQLKKYYYDPAKFRTYLEQLRIPYPTVRSTP
jgi:aminobenzoyl-glutamate utilization protein B